MSLAWVKVESLPSVLLDPTREQKIPLDIDTEVLLLKRSKGRDNRVFICRYVGHQKPETSSLYGLRGSGRKNLDFGVRQAENGY